ncbi:MAG TPA: DUF3943 domain-containing protein, partial [Anaeromyxobacteraceae bacterium]|nr:DUF3943 domain-containing protein [Anaeromyxobacteraceae bacterium]
GLIMGWNRYVGEAPWATVTTRTVGDNLRAGWVLDDNPYFVNQLGHPYQGAFPYTAARSAGVGFWAATAYPFAASALWELAGETEKPSVNDQVTTTVGGVVLGEVLYRVSDWVRGDGRSLWRGGVATLLAPMTTVNRSVVRGAPREEPSSLRLTMGAGVLATLEQPRGTAASLPPGPAPALGLALTSGVPGDPDFAFERPFDHFDAVLAFAPSQDAYLSLRARGLLAGTDFGAGERGGGLFGLWLGFDLESPGARRISTSALGVGATGRWALRPEVTLEGTAIGSAVLMGAAGLVDAPPGSHRDYRFGPGQQALVDLRVALGDRVAAGVTLRQYLIFGAADESGHDVLLDGALSARLRIVGHHGLAASASRFLRLAREGDGSSTSQEGSMLILSWIYAVDPPRPVAARTPDAA